MTHRAAAVAGRAIEYALRGQRFQVSDLQDGTDDTPSRQTIYRVLDELASDDWVEREGKYWRPGFKADALGDVDEVADRGGFSLDSSDLLE